VSLVTTRVITRLIPVFREKSHVTQPVLVTLQRTGKRGRPRKIISPLFLKNTMGPGRNIPRTKLGKVLGLNRKTVAANMKLQNVSHISFSPIANDDLDAIVKRYKDRHPMTGIQYVRGYLLSRHIRVQKRRVEQSVGRVSKLSSLLRRQTIIKRQQYLSSRPNALWHIDGHHKLILWGIVIHGIADGYDRSVSLTKTVSIEVSHSH
jgi:hypothetical protein